MEQVVLKKGYALIDVYKMVIEDSLPNISTAQTINAGFSGQERVNAYMNDIKNGSAGYFAMVKNIKTLLENEISESDLKLWANFITEPKRVAKSMVLPFRFVDAWDAVKNLSVNEFKKSIVKKALERAFALSVNNTNIIEDGEKIAVLLDESYSMNGKPFKIGKSLAAALKVGLNPDDCLFYTWADTCTLRDVNNMSSFDFINSLNCSGGGTDVSAPLNKLITTKTSVDKIIILSDMQMYDNGFGNLGNQVKFHLDIYKKDVNPDVKVLFWNLEGYSGGSPIDLEKTNEVFEISGFSDKLLEIAPKLWKDKDFLIKEIDNISL